MATELLSPKSDDDELFLRRYSSADLAESCNISVKQAEDFIASSEINFDQNGTLDLNQFQQLKQQIMARSALFSNSFNSYYADENNSNPNANPPSQAPKSKMKYNIGSDHDINTNAYNDRFDSDKASIDTQDLYKQEMDLANEMADNFSEICDKMEQLKSEPKHGQIDNNVDPQKENKKQKLSKSETQPKSKRPIKILLNGSPFGVKPKAITASNSSPFGKKANTNSVVTNDTNKRAIISNNKSDGIEGKQSRPLPYKVRVTRPISNQNNNNSYGIPPRPNGIQSSNINDPFNIMPKRITKYRHNWNLGIKYDLDKDCVVINVSDIVTNKKWIKYITASDCTNGNVKQEYFRLGKLVANGTTSYSEPHKGSYNVQVTITSNNEIYNILVTPI